MYNAHLYAGAHRGQRKMLEPLELELLLILRFTRGKPVLQFLSQFEVSFN